MNNYNLRANNRKRGFACHDHPDNDMHSKEIKVDMLYDTATKDLRQELQEFVDLSGSNIGMRTLEARTVTGTSAGILKITADCFTEFRQNMRDGAGWQKQKEYYKYLPEHIAVMQNRLQWTIQKLELQKREICEKILLEQEHEKQIEGNLTAASHWDVTEMTKIVMENVPMRKQIIKMKKKMDELDRLVQKDTIALNRATQSYNNILMAWNRNMETRNKFQKSMKCYVESLLNDALNNPDNIM